MHRAFQAGQQREHSGDVGFLVQRLYHDQQMLRVRLVRLMDLSCLYSRIVNGRSWNAGESSMGFEAIRGISILSEGNETTG